MATRMQQRRGTAAQWTSSNPILNTGEIGFETDTNKFKIGDGTNHWADLAYFVDQDTVTTSLGDYVETSTLGQPDGVATLDSTGQIPVSQLGNIIDGAPGVLDTINEIAAAINDDPTFFTTVATNLSNHESDTTNVHGIANTADLATKTYADSAVSTHNSDTTNVHGIADTSALALTSDVNDALSLKQDKIAGVSDTEIGYLSNVTSDIQQQIDSKSPKISIQQVTTDGTVNETYSDITTIQFNEDSGFDVTSPTAGTAKIGINSTFKFWEIDGTPTLTAEGLDTLDLITGDGISITGDGTTGQKSLTFAVDNTIATKTYADDAVSTHNSDTSSHGVAGDIVGTSDSQTLTNKTISSTNNTISVTVSNITDVSASAAEINTLDGITANVNELNVLDGITSSTAELNILDGVTSSTAELNILDGATLSTTELNYVDGVTSSIQTQLDAKLDKSGGTMTGDITLAGAPTQALHAATKAYVDAVTEGLHIHPSCQAATTTNVAIATDLEPGDVVDGVTLAEGDRVLVKAQTNAAQNGIYVVQASGAALRASDFNEPQEVDGGDFVFVTGGTLYDNTGWVQTTTNVVTIGTDPIVFTQFSGAGTYTAGTGLELNGTVFSIDTGTTVDVSTAQTLTNKTISAADNTLTIATTDLTDVTASAAEINILDGATLSTAELNILDGVTATTSEINTLAGITASTAELNILDGVTASASEINILDGATLTTAELNYVDGVTSAIQTQLDAKLDSTTASSTYLTQSTASSTYAPIASPTFTGTVSGITKSMVGLANVDNTSDADKPVSTATQTALNLKANLASPTFTGTVILPSTTSIGNVSDTELGYLDGVTSAIQTQLDAKAVYPAQTGNNGKYLTTNGSNVSWGTVSAYSAPTLGITSIASGATVTTVEALGLKHSQLISPKEKVNVIAGAPGAFITLYTDTAGVYYYTSNATTNFGVTFDFSASYDLNFKMAIGESITFVLLVTNGATAYYPTSHSVVFTSVTPKWQGGTAPTGGNINSIDAYSYTIIKTANNTFTVLASQTKFA